jgi:hypothetical protein
MGYQARPMANWPTNTAGTPSGNTADPAYWIPSIDATTTTKAVVAMPRLSRLKNKAIVSDLIFHPQVVKMRHKNGVNVLYANGSAQWIDVGTLNKLGVFPSIGLSWKSMAPDPGWLFPVMNNPLMLDENPAPPRPPTGIWWVLDQASR